MKKLYISIMAFGLISASTMNFASMPGTGATRTASTKNFNHLSSAQDISKALNDIAAKVKNLPKNSSRKDVTPIVDQLYQIAFSLGRLYQTKSK